MARAGQPARLNAFASCAPGVEALTAAELRALGVRVGHVEPGGVTFAATTRQLYASLVWLRTASRVVVRVASFPAATFAELEARARRVDWAPWLAPGAPIEVRAAAHRSRLHHTGGIAERVAGAMPAGAGGRVLVRVVHDRVTVSVDACGELLHKRGWRTEAGPAPLRETLAAAMLLAVGWDGRTALADPMCGAGTIPIEAALLARRMAPGAGRRFAVQAWPCFEPGTWASVTGEVRSRALASSPVPIVAGDTDPAAVAATVANAERAGVAGDLDVRLADAVAFEPCGSWEQAGAAARPGPGWIVTNPPYGRRLEADAAALAVPPGWGLAVLHPDPVAGCEPVLAVRNGGLPVRLWVRPPASPPVPRSGSPSPAGVHPDPRSVERVPGPGVA